MTSKFIDFSKFGWATLIVTALLTVGASTKGQETSPFRAEAPAYEPDAKALKALIPTPSRKWTNPEGKTVLGIVSAFDAEAKTTTLRTAAGEILESFSLSQYSETDQNYLLDASKGMLSGMVVGVHDGDSMTLLVAGNTQFKIRLEAIDAPEIGQEFGTKSKLALGNMIHGKQVVIHVTGTDKYKRLLGFIWLQDTLINQAMIEQGFARHFKEYSTDKKLAESEVKARDSKKGLWSGFKPMAPWDWRDLKKSETTSTNLVKPFTTSTPTESGPSKNEVSAARFWLNLSGSKRHNASCRWFGNTKRGRYCTKSEGSACGICGG